MAKKNTGEEALEKATSQALVNPLLSALAENDKNHLFKANVTTAFIKTGFAQFDYYFGSTMNIHDELDNIISQEARVGQAAGTFNLIIGNTGSGKAQPLSTWLPSPNGNVMMRHVTEGTKLFGFDGKIIKVTGIYPQGVQDVYKLTFNDGRSTYCTKDHLWTVYDDENNALIVTLDQILDVMSKRHGNCPFRFPVISNPVEYRSVKTAIDPYAAGVMYGMANWFKTVPLYEYEPAIINTFKDKLNDDNRNIEIEDIINIIKNNGKIDLIDKDLASVIDDVIDMRISPKYSQNDVGTRWSFLQGVMDTAATVTYHLAKYTQNNGVTEFIPSQFRISLTVHDKVFCEQILSMIRSMGIVAYVASEVNPFSKNEKYRANIVIRATTHQVYKLFRNGRNATVVTSIIGAADGNDNPPCVELQEVYFHHEEECQCIKVDAADELYLCDDYVVTHNTTLAAQIAANIIQQYDFANVIHFDCENRFDMSRCETITRLPASYFRSINGSPERYMIRGGRVGLDVIQEMIARTYFNKLKIGDALKVTTPYYDEFKRPIRIYQPTVIIIDSLATVLSETFNPESSKDAAEAEKMRSNTDGARDAKTLRGFLKDILPMCKEANILIYGINHINQNMAMNAFLPVAKQQNFLKQDESIPGGRALIYSAQNIIKLVARTSDSFTEETDGFNGYMVLIEPVKSSSNQSGNTSKGISFELVFSQKTGFDSLRSLILYGRDVGKIVGNKPKMKFVDDDSFTFSWKNLYTEINDNPIIENINKFVVPTLSNHLSFIDPAERTFDARMLMY